MWIEELNPSAKQKVAGGMPGSRSRRLKPGRSRQLVPALPVTRDALEPVHGAYV